MKASSVAWSSDFPSALPMIYLRARRSKAGFTGRYSRAQLALRKWLAPRSAANPGQDPRCFMIYQCCLSATARKSVLRRRANERIVVAKRIGQRSSCLVAAQRPECLASVGADIRIVAL